ncbi:MAG TPA: hypothetical protein VLX85_05055 [Stellaceae bacterium]|nr:hypothetical protein [Stellaceae bacterium]
MDLSRFRPGGCCRSVICAVAVALLLAGCAASSGSWPPPGYDPYHYRCTGNCQAG